MERGRQQRRWRDGLKELLMGRRLSERDEMVLARDREAWGRRVDGLEYMEGMSL